VASSARNWNRTRWPKRFPDTSQHLRRRLGFSWNRCVAERNGLADTRAGARRRPPDHSAAPARCRRGLLATPPLTQSNHHPRAAPKDIILGGHPKPAIDRQLKSGHSGSDRDVDVGTERSFCRRHEQCLGRHDTTTDSGARTARVVVHDEQRGRARCQARGYEHVRERDGRARAHATGENVPGEELLASGQAATAKTSTVSLASSGASVAAAIRGSLRACVGRRTVWPWSSRSVRYVHPTPSETVRAAIEVPSESVA
jgi:hypothetical protein